MSKRQLLILLGVWVMVFLFLGFPPEWDKVFSIIVGLLIVISAIRSKSPAKVVSPDRVPFVEHKSAHQQTPAPTPVSAVTSSDPITSTETLVS